MSGAYSKSPMRKKWLNRRPLDIKEILAWADAYREATGSWPTGKRGPIAGTKFETWAAVESALRGGRRGLPGGSSLARLLAQERGRRLPRRLPELAVATILGWADAYHGQTGTWQTRTSGTIPQSGGETWAAVATALQEGRRGLPGGSSLARFLAQHRG